jgi:nitrate reductase NapE component
VTQAAPNHTDHHPPERRHEGHRWMMIACCIPMLVIAVALVATGVVSTGFLVVAVACTVMMALMMGAMPGHGEGHR